jgi:predicted TIM-barrel fold metal-dependent hydrolase
MFEDLKNLYHNEDREKFLKAFYTNLAEALNKYPRILDLKFIFDHHNHPKFLKRTASEEEIHYEFNEMADSFQFINVTFK